MKTKSTPEPGDLRERALRLLARREQSRFELARKLGQGAVERGYREIGTQVTRLPDPSDEARTLDSWFEVAFERVAPGLDEAMAEVRFTLSLEKAASRT